MNFEKFALGVAVVIVGVFATGLLMDALKGESDIVKKAQAGFDA